MVSRFLKYGLVGCTPCRRHRVSGLGRFDECNKCSPKSDIQMLCENSVSIDAVSMWTRLRAGVAWVLCLVFVLPSVANALPYAGLHADFEPIRKMNAIEGVSVLPTAHLKDPTARGARLAFVIHAAAGDIVENVAPDGSFSFPDSDSLLRENPNVQLLVNGEVEKPNTPVEFSVAIHVPARTPTETLDASEYNRMVKRYDEAIATQGFLVRLAMPKPRGVLVRFPSGVTGTATAPDGSPIKVWGDSATFIDAERIKATSKGAFTFSPAPTIELDVN